MAGAAMPQATAMAFTAALGVRWQWLLNGEGAMLLDDTGKLTADELRLIQIFRDCDMEARDAITEQADFQRGKSDRRRERKQ
jgi:hypothetical protein